MHALNLILFIGRFYKKLNTIFKIVHRTVPEQLPFAAPRRLRPHKAYSPGV